MRFHSISIALVAISEAVSAAQLLICSDSTTANYALDDTLQGWGYYINNYTTLSVKNLARNGRSTRSFINEGLWSSLLSATKAGDYVLIEMGHNDDVDPTTDTKDRGTLPGTGSETVVVRTQAGVNETVHTFGCQESDADHLRMVPRNYWTGETLQKDWAFADYAAEVAVASGVEYVDHTRYSVALFQSYGSAKAKTFFPEDNTHTNAAGAVLNAQTFVQAVKCHCGKKSKLARHLNTAAKKLNVPECQPC